MVILTCQRYYFLITFWIKISMTDINKDEVINKWLDIKLGSMSVNYNNSNNTEFWLHDDDNTGDATMYVTKRYDTIYSTGKFNNEFSLTFQLDDSVFERLVLEWIKSKFGVDISKIHYVLSIKIILK